MQQRKRLHIYQHLHTHTLATAPEPALEHAYKPAPPPAPAPVSSPGPAHKLEHAFAHTQASKPAAAISAHMPHATTPNHLPHFTIDSTNISGFAFISPGTPPDPIPQRQSTPVGHNDLLNPLYQWASPATSQRQPLLNVKLKNLSVSKASL